MTPTLDPQEFLYLLPEAILATGGMVLLLLGVFGKTGLRARGAAIFTLATLALTALAVWRFQLPEEAARTILAGLFVLDGYAFFWKFLLLVATALTVLLSVEYVAEASYRAGEFFALLLLAATGMLLMVGGVDLLAIWVSLELMALSSYLLAGYFKRETRSNEAALKYFVLGALSSGILLYGISLLYGATGTLGLDELAVAMPEVDGGVLLTLGWIFLAAGLFFKIAAVPFHVWAPDVYVGAPTPVTAFLAVASKAASFAILVRIFFQALGGLATEWTGVVAVVAVVSMVWGNLAALTQDNVKRMLAYSSIAHAGYALMGVLAVSEVGLTAVLFYLVAYSFINLGAFGLVVLLERKEYAGESCQDYAGLARRAPLLAASMLIFMLALTGIPPTGGFVGKLFLFGAAVEAGWTWVAVIGVVMSAVSLYYYFRLVYFMYLAEEGSETPAPASSALVVAAIVACAVVTLVLGVAPGPVLDFARGSLAVLAGLG